MYLVIDVGNTRIKWALAGDDLALHSHDAAVHSEFTGDLMGAWLREHGKAIRSTLVANVGGSKFDQVLTDALREHTGRVPQFLQSTRELCGVRNAYRTPEKLGADRWAAMIGARHVQAGAACVVSVGTAMTIDVIDQGSQHLGGLILPGPRLMIASLLTNTSEIALRANGGERDRSLLAVDTLGAISQGAEQALAALVDRVAGRMQRQIGGELNLILTGGASDLIQPLLETPARLIPDLVLRGLAVVASSAAGRAG
jgi:type III pantothenate kinase